MSSIIILTTWHIGDRIYSKVENLSRSSALYTKLMKLNRIPSVGRHCEHKESSKSNVIDLHWCFPVADKILVLTAYFVGRNERMWLIILLGKSLSLSTSSIGFRCFWTEPILPLLFGTTQSDYWQEEFGGAMELKTLCKLETFSRSSGVIEITLPAELKKYKPLN